MTELLLHRTIKLFLGLLIAASMAGCGGTIARSTTSTTPAASTVAVTVSPVSASIQAGGIQQFDSTVTGATNTAVTWFINGNAGGNSTFGTISSGGTYTAPALSPAGPVTVTAKSVQDATATASATVTVTAPVHGTPTPTPTPTANDRYVSPAGNDANDGTYGHPWKTITHANSMAQPGYTIHVAPGTYTLYPTLNLTTPGTPSARIIYISDTKWGAKLISSGSTGSPDWNAAVRVSGNYITVKGFEISSVNSSTLMAGMVMGGSYQFAEGNKVHDIPAPGPTGVGGAGIEVSLFNPRSMTFGTGNQVIGNLVYNIGGADPTGHRTHGIYFANRNGYIANNIVHHVYGGWGVKIGHAADHITAVNNTVFSNNYGGMVVGTSTTDNGGTRPDYIYLANNIVYNNGIGPNPAGYGILEYDTSADLGPNCQYVDNLVYGNTPSDWKLEVTGGTGIGTISAEPGFVNWQTDGSGDYHLAAGSPAVNNGNGTRAPNTDAEGRARPVGGNWDIGAYEYGATPGAWPY